MTIHPHTSLLRYAVWAGLLLLAGCRAVAPAPAQPPRYRDGIITPMPPDRQVCGACMPWYNQSRDDDRVEDLVLGYILTTRDFKPPAGPDGFVLSVTPLQKKAKGQPVATGRLTICLFKHPQGGMPLDPNELLRMWQLESDELVRFWAQTHLLNCYMLFLDWDRPPDTGGPLLFTVTMDYEQGKGTRRLCRHLSVPGGPDATISTRFSRSGQETGDKPPTGQTDPGQTGLDPPH